MSGINAAEWDDTLLVKAYESSLKLAQEELARRIAKATNSKKTSPKNLEDKTASATAEKEPIACTSKPKHAEEEENPTFNVGDYARATYDDGVDYEGKIIAVNEDEGICRIRYIGYENEQDVQICDLVPSWGKKARRLQFCRAKQEAAKEASSASDNRKGNRTQFSMTSNGFPIGAIPPPPPMPFMIGQDQCESAEHLSAMLMSWYMSGYYTGLYQGMQMAKTNSTKQKK